VPGSFTDNHRQLALAQKSNAGAPIYSVLVNRRLGRFFAALAHVVGLTPNAVTVISALFTYSGILVLGIARPTWAMAIVVTACLVLGYGLDAADGQLARLRGGGSVLGEWLDHVIDSGKIVLLQVAVTAMFHRHYGDRSWWLLVPALFLVATVVHFFGMLLTDLLTRLDFARRGEPMPGRRSGSMLMSWAKLPTDYGLLCWVFLLVPLPSIFHWVYLVLAVLTSAYTLLVLVKWAKGLPRTR
jgi:phosphatidylglycerophosphate synthase